MFREKFEGKSGKIGKEGINGLLGSNPSALTKNQVNVVGNSRPSITRLTAGVVRHDAMTDRKEAKLMELNASQVKLPLS